MKPYYYQHKCFQTKTSRADIRAKGLMVPAIDLVAEQSHRSSQGFLFEAARNRSSRGEGDFFHDFPSNNQGYESGLSFLKRGSLDISKIESTVYEQNDRKYKEVLKEFYNNQYHVLMGRKREEVYLEMNTKKKSMEGSQSYSKAFQGNRLVFSKERKTKGALSRVAFERYLVKKVSDSKRREILIFQMKNLNYKDVNPIRVEAKYLKNFDNCSSFEYDLQNKRLYCFDNSTNQVVGLGLSKLNVLCRIKLRSKRNQPILYYHCTQQKQYLMVIGGFFSKGEGVIEGSGYIEVFLIKRWEIVLKPLIIKLSIGRICPIVFSCDHNGESSVYVIGGNSNATGNHRLSKLIFPKEQEGMNETTNQTGVRISSSLIDLWFQSEQENIFIVNNLNIRFENPLMLYNGCVLLRKLNAQQKLQLFLNGGKPIYNIKILKNDVHIFGFDIMLTKVLKEKEQMRLTICSHVYKELESPYCQVDSKGCLQLLKAQSNLGFKDRCSLM